MSDLAPQMIFTDQGLISYDKALLFQEELVEKRHQHEVPDTVIFCSHPPVVTLGRSTQAQDVQEWQGDVVHVSRGGRATYHGPGQRIIYPIIDLRQEGRKKIRPKDVMSYLETFELAVLETLKEVGLSDVHLKEDVTWDEQGKKLLNRGIWIADKKVAAFGIAVRKWITYHGCAINLTRDAASFQGIQPCGYSTNAVGYIEDFLNLSDLNLDQTLQEKMLSLMS
ncbi:MAG: lipoyl(octanoyl) transferase LipB [Bdellovibrionaceae bacterium]|nr:lipoyl(octanoyl) transferase LipB [Pseudobdellovibrionaceae bacterium]